MTLARPLYRGHGQGERDHVAPGASGSRLGRTRPARRRPLIRNPIPTAAEILAAPEFEDPDSTNPKIGTAPLH